MLFYFVLYFLVIPSLLKFPSGDEPISEDHQNEECCLKPLLKVRKCPLWWIEQLKS